MFYLISICEKTVSKKKPTNPPNNTFYYNVMYLHIHFHTLHVNILISGFALFNFGHEKFQCLNGEK